MNGCHRNVDTPKCHNGNKQDLTGRNKIRNEKNSKQLEQNKTKKPTLTLPPPILCHCQPSLGGGTPQTGITGRARSWTMFDMVKHPGCLAPISAEMFPEKGPMSPVNSCSYD